MSKCKQCGYEEELFEKPKEEVKKKVVRITKKKVKPEPEPEPESSSSEEEIIEEIESSSSEEVQIKPKTKRKTKTKTIIRYIKEQKPEIESDEEQVKQKPQQEYYNPYSSIF